MELGTIIPQKYFNNVANPQITSNYFKHLLKNFNIVGTLAFGQMGFIAKNKPDEYKWETVDKFISFAESNNLKAQYNTVINNKQSFPDWFWKLNKEEKLQSLENHIRTVVRRYRGKVEQYKLVNEVVGEPEEDFLDTGVTKSKLIAKFFRWAKEEDPTCSLMLNDYPMFFNDNLRNDFIDMTNRIIGNGGPVDVIGIQGHFGHPSPKNTPLHQLPNKSLLLETLILLHDKTKLPLQITEFDISYDNKPATEYSNSKVNPTKPFSSLLGEFKNWYEYQAAAYKHFYEICNDVGYISRFYFWGFYDGDFEDLDRPGVGFFDKDFNEKPVFKTLKDKFLPLS